MLSNGTGIQLWRFPFRAIFASEELVMNCRLLLLIALCSTPLVAQLKPAPGFQPKTPQQNQQQPTTTPAPQTAAPVSAPKANATGGYDLAVSADKQWTV